MRNPIRLKNLSARLLPLYLIALMLLYWHPPTPARLAWAAGPIGLGLGLRSWAAGHLVKSERLTTGGPYAHLRHPLYAGTLCIGTGLVGALGGWVGLVGVALLWPWFAFSYFPRKERSEAARLEAIHGERFRRYRAVVPALWPRLRPFAPADDVASAAAPAWQIERYSENNELGTLLAVVAAYALCFGFALGAPG